MNIGKIIKLIRIQRGMSQKNMAEQLKISQNYLSLIESNKKDPSGEMSAEIAKELGVSKEAFLFASSNIPAELSERDKQDYQKLQNNIMHLLLFDSNIVDA